MSKSKIFSDIVKSESFINIRNISMNSKEVGKDDLFIAIKGGNNFLDEALQKGAYVIYDSDSVKISEEFLNRAFKVEDSVLFLQEFAGRWRKNLNITVVAITGSNGKTSVKDMTYHLLSKKYKGKKTEGNYNNHIGLPFTLLRAEEDDKFMILEMGMSGFGEIELLSEIALPDISIITNIGESHLEFLETKENVFKAKSEILPYTQKTLIVNGDDEYLKNINLKHVKTVKIFKSSGGDSVLKIPHIYYNNIKFNEKGTSFSFSCFDGNTGKMVNKIYKTNIIGEHNVLNLSLALAVSREFEIEDKLLEEAVQNISLTDMRFQIIDRGDTTYINDAYNASPISMEKALETFSKIYNDREKIIVMGDMLELGNMEAEFHANLFNTVKQIKFHRLYLFGVRMSFLYKKIEQDSENENFKNKEVKYFSEKEEIIKELSKIKEKKAVLIKASRGIKLEEIIK